MSRGKKRATSTPKAEKPEPMPEPSLANGDRVLYIGHLHEVIDPAVRKTVKKRGGAGSTEAGLVKIARVSADGASLGKHFTVMRHLVKQPDVPMMKAEQRARAREFYQARVDATLPDSPVRRHSLAMLKQLPRPKPKLVAPAAEEKTAAQTKKTVDVRTEKAGKLEKCERVEVTTKKATKIHDWALDAARAVLDVAAGTVLGPGVRKLVSVEAAARAIQAAAKGRAGILHEPRKVVVMKPSKDSEDE